MNGKLQEITESETQQLNKSSKPMLGPRFSGPSINISQTKQPG